MQLGTTKARGPGEEGKEKQAGKQGGKFGEYVGDRLWLEISGRKVQRDDGNGATFKS